MRNNILRKFSLLLVLILIISLIQNLAFAINIPNDATLTIDYSEETITVKGTGFAGIQAVAVLLYDTDGTTLLRMASFGVKLDNTFEAVMNIPITNSGNYTIKVADYEGGDFKTETFSVYSVTLNTSSTGATGSGYYMSGSTVSITPGTKSDHTFSGWVVNSGGVTIANNEFVMPVSNVIITANWTTNSSGSTPTPNPTPVITPPTSTSTQNPTPDITPPTSTSTPNPTPDITLPTSTSTPTPTPTITVQEMPKTEGDKTIIVTNVSPIIEKEKAFATVTQETVKEAVDSVNNVAKEAGTKAVLDINVTAPESAETIELTIPKTALSYTIESGVEVVRVSTNLASLSFDLKALDAISSVAVSDVKISIDVVDSKTLSISDETKKKIEGKPVFDFSIKSGDSIISEFKGEKVNVTIPYSLKEEENPNAIVIYYISDDGSLKTEFGIYDIETRTVKIMLSHFSKYAVGYNKMSFTDVASGVWYQEAVDFVSARDLFKGIGADQFAPTKTMTRAMFATVIARLDGADLSAYKESKFTDVNINSWYGASVAYAKEKGIVNGTGNGKFSPNAEISREEMAVMLNNYIKYREIILDTVNDTPFSDSEKVSSWAKDAVAAIHRYGIINGVGNNTFEPSNNAQRSHVAQIFMNLINAILK